MTNRCVSRVRVNKSRLLELFGEEEVRFKIGSHHESHSPLLIHMLIRVVANVTDGVVVIIYYYRGASGVFTGIHARHVSCWFSGELKPAETLTPESTG